MTCGQNHQLAAIGFDPPLELDEREFRELQRVFESGGKLRAEEHQVEVRLAAPVTELLCQFSLRRQPLDARDTERFFRHRFERTQQLWGQQSKLDRDPTIEGA